MKKQNKRSAQAKDKKLLLTVDKVRDLRHDEMRDVAGGMSCCFTHPSGGTGGN